MQSFKYNFFARIIYRYANIPANLILLIYLLISILGTISNWKFIFPLLITIILIYTLNRFYLKIYKKFPFKIEADNEKLVCSEFTFKNRIIEINHSEIIEISGGIFSGRAYMPLYIKTKTDLIGISPHISEYNKLLTILLTNIPKELYENLLEKIKSIAINNPVKEKSKKKK
jgi:hypothetical protein